MSGAAARPGGRAGSGHGGRRRRAAPALLATAVVLAAPAPAPGQWVEEPGSGWIDLRLYHHDTREEFGPDGDERDFFASGHAITTSIYLTAAAGLVRGVDAWVQLPLHDLSFEDAAGRRQRTGLGDPRLYLRVGPSLFGLSGPAVALRGGVKIPAAEFPVDAEVIPLTEGQTDWELYLELGRSFHPAPLYAMGWIGYRWREAKGTVRDPGDEGLAYLAVGGDLGARVVWKLAGEGLWGLTPVIDRVPVESASRRIVQLFPSIGVRVGPGAIDVGGRVPLDGRNLPAGPALVAGYFLDWSLR